MASIRLAAPAQRAVPASASGTRPVGGLRRRWRWSPLVAALVVAVGVGILVAGGPVGGAAASPQPGASSSAGPQARSTPTHSTAVSPSPSGSGAMPSWYTNPSVTSSPTLGGGPPSGGGNPFGWDIAGEVGTAISLWLQVVAAQALGPVAEILGGIAPHTPALTGNHQVRQLWTAAVVVVDTSFVLLIVIAGVQVVGRETLQSRQAAKQFAPRLAVAMIAAHCNLPVIAEAIRLTNAVCAALGADSKTPATQQALHQIGALEIGHGESFLASALGVAVVVMLVAAILTFLVRLALLVFLIAGAPLAMACWALPQTDGIARLWCRAMAALLGIQIAQTVLLTAFLRVFLVPRGHLVLGLPADKDDILNLLVCLTLLWILVKIPGWAKRLVFRQPIMPLPNRPRLPRTVTNVVKGVLIAKTLGAVGLLGHHGARTATALAGRGGRPAGGTRLGLGRPGSPRPSGPSPRPRTTLGVTAGPTRGPAAAMFSAAPLAQTPLLGTAGTTAVPRFSHSSSAAAPIPRPTASTGGSPRFSHAPTAHTPVLPPTGHPQPSAFSHAPQTPPSPPTARPARPLSPAFSDAPAARAAPACPPTLARPAFSDAPPEQPRQRPGRRVDPSAGGDR